MLLRLNKIIEAPGTVSFEETLDLRDMVIGAQQPVTEPVVAAGEVRNVAGSEGVLELRGEDTHVQFITDPATQLPIHEIGRQHDRIVVDHIGKLLDRPEIDIQFFIVERVLCTPCT